MAQRFIGFLGMSVLFALPGGGCIGTEPSAGLNAPRQGNSFTQSGVAEYYAYHNDQGMLADMSIADIHFVPQTAVLSGTGEARLERFAELLAKTGGTLNYETSITDEKLIESRLATVREFLADAIPGNHDIDVVLGLPGGRGMDAREALAAQEVAKQPEPRERAYRLSDKTGVRETGS